MESIAELELFLEVEDILKQYVSPILKLHGGNVRLKTINNGIVKLEFKGNCKGCPSAQLTAENIVKEELKKHMGEKIKDVILFSEVNEELWNFAKKILNNKYK